MGLSSLFSNSKGNDGRAQKYSFEKRNSERKKPPGREWLPLVTLYLFSITLFIYYLSVSFFPFVSPSYDLLSTFGLHYNAPWSVFTYLFIHLWPSHLLVDGLLLLIFGTIVERKIGGWKTLVIFLSSGFLGGLVNLLFFPEKTLIGSSGAVFGLIGAAIVLRPFLSMALFIGSLQVFAPLVVRAVDSVETAFVERISSQNDALAAADSALWDKLSDLSSQREALNSTISLKGSEIESLKEDLVALGDLRAQGKISESEYSERSRNLIEAIGDLEENLTLEARKMTLVSRDLVEVSEERKVIISEKREIEKKEYQLSVTERTKAGTPEAPYPHTVGLVFGGLLVFFLEKEAFKEWEEKYVALKGLFFRAKPGS